MVAALAAVGRDRRALRALQRRSRQLQPVEHAALGGRLLALACRRRFRRWALRGRPEAVEQERKSVGSGKGVSVRVDLGGRRVIKNNTNTNRERAKIKKRKQRR